MAPATDPVTTVVDQLRDLVTSGFQFLHPCRDDGELVAVVGIRAHDQVVDVIQVRTETDAVATRVPGDEVNLLKPASVVWQRTGPANTVLAELLELPDDHAGILRDQGIQQPQALR
jgi:hypothetical protein